MNRFIIINELAEKRALKSSCSSPVSSPSACNLLDSYIFVGFLHFGRSSWVWGWNSIPEENLHASGGFSQWNKTVWSIIKLFILKRENGFHQYTHLQCLTSWWISVTFYCKPSESLRNKNLGSF